MRFGSSSETSQRWVKSTSAFFSAQEEKMIQIDQEHLEYKRQASTWRVYRDLYAGGHQFKLRAADYLLPRQKEPLDVYGERLQRVFYENYIGSIVDWYASTLFRREPSMTFEGSLDSGQPDKQLVAGDCDLKRTRLVRFVQRCLIEALVVG